MHDHTAERAEQAQIEECQNSYAKIGYITFFATAKKRGHQAFCAKCRRFRFSDERCSIFTVAMNPANLKR